MKAEVAQNKQAALMNQNKFLREYPMPIVLEAPDSTSPLVITNAPKGRI
jgi:hypothetical protein